jgi:hypothetical protein
MHTSLLLSSSKYFKTDLAKSTHRGSYLVRDCTIYTSYVYSTKCLRRPTKGKFNSCEAWYIVFLGQNRQNNHTTHYFFWDKSTRLLSSVTRNFLSDSWFYGWIRGIHTALMSLQCCHSFHKPHKTAFSSRTALLGWLNVSIPHHSVFLTQHTAFSCTTASLYFQWP